MNNISSLAFDLDGTVYHGDSVIDGAMETIDSLINLGYQIFYFTNNSAKTREQIVDKLNKLGFQVKPENTYCASHSILIYLIKNKITPVYLIGSDDLKKSLIINDIEVVNSPEVSAVVVGLDANFNYNKISTALEAINNGAKLIVANNDSSYPIENNKELPGCGAIVGAIVGATFHAPDFIVGKPNTYMLELLCKDHKLSAEKICIVGDNQESDIRMANNFNCQSMLFDPQNKFPAFSGIKIGHLREIILLINKKG